MGMVVRDPLCGVPLRPEEAKFSAEVRGRTYYFCSEQHMRTFLEGQRIAYFSMEIGITSEIPTYSGGLGVLAGDTIRSSADLRIPMVAVSLVSRMGYLRQKLAESGEQLEYPDPWDPARYMRKLPESVRIAIEGRHVALNAWVTDLESPTGFVVPILLLDTDVEGNSPEDRTITHHLYGGDDLYRLKQAVVLGIGGVRMLEALGFRISKYHINEGQSGLLLLELLKRHGMDPDRVRDRCVFTTHTPVSSAFYIFPYALVETVLGDEYPLEQVKKYAGADTFNTTSLALNLSGYVNGVTRAHMEYSRRLFPGYYLRAVTNGVHPATWTSPPFRALFDRHIPGWANEPELLVRVDDIPREEIRSAHREAKRALLEYVRERDPAGMEERVLTLGFARRATAYKRAALIFSDLDRLREIQRRQPLQLIFAGKAHPRDLAGKQLIRDIHTYREELRGEMRIVYLENYSMDAAAKLTAGVDVWLNTPLPPFEASGTSGMKAAFNGVINFSVLDGWWIEGCVEGITGWAIGPDPREEIGLEERRRRERLDLYNKLEYLILPAFYRDGDAWASMMRNSIARIAYYFNSHRMMRRYASEAYL